MNLKLLPSVISWASPGQAALGWFYVSSADEDPGAQRGLAGGIAEPGLDLRSPGRANAMSVCP